MLKQTLLNRELFVRGPKVFGLAIFCVVLTLMAILTALQPATKVQAATNSNLNFQARLQTSGGALAADGYYNIEFKLYSASSGGSALWTETYYDSNGVTAGNDNRVRIKNGYLTVNLGSITAFPAGINWDQQLWITMNVGGVTQTATPTWDGEMSPRLKLTGVPYAFRAGELAAFNSTSGFTGVLQFQNTTGGDQTFIIPDQGAAGTYTLMTTASASGSFVQFAPSSAQVDALTNSSIFINKTGASGNILQLQKNGTDKFLVTNAGNVGINATGANLLSVNNLTTADSLAQLALSTGATTNKGLVVQGVASQTADLMQLQTSNGNVKAAFHNNGGLDLGGATLNGTSSATTSAIGDKLYLWGNTYRFGVQSSDLQIASGGGISLRPSANTVGGTAINGQILQLSGTAANTLSVLRGATSQTGDLLQLQNTNGAILSKINSNGQLISYGTGAQFLNLAVPAFTTASTGTSFYYCITATNAAGETVCSTSLGMANNTSTLQWNQVNGATGYKIYRNTSDSFTSGSLLLTTITNGTTVSFADTGAATGAGLPPTNPTGSKLTLQDWAGQTGNLFEVLNSSGSAFYRIAGSGDFISSSSNNTVTGLIVGGNYGGHSSNRLLVQSNGAGLIAQVIQGTVSQTVDLFQIQDSAANVNAAFNATGAQLTLGRIAASGTVTQGKLVLSDGTTDNFGLTLQSATLTANRTISLPNEDGTLCIQGSANCGFALSATNGYVQLAPGAAQTDATTNSSIFINKTGASGNILQLQKNGSGVVTIDNNGNLSVATMLSVGSNPFTAKVGVVTSGVALNLLNAGSVDIAQFGNAAGTSGVVLSKVGADGAFTTYGTNNTFGHLATPAFTTATDCGTPGYYYVMTATNAAGETVASTSLCRTTNTVTLNWTQINGATGYKIYRNTTNSFTSGSLLLTTITNGTTVSYADTGSATGAGLPPATVTGTGATLQAWEGQTGNVLTVRNSSGGALASVSGTGKVTGNTIQANSSGTASNALVVQGVVGQAGDLLQLRDNSSNINAAFNGAGNQLTLGRIASSGTVTQGKLVLSDGTTDNFGLTLQSTTLTANRTINLPNEDGTLCIQGSTACGFAPSATNGYVQLAPAAAQTDATTNSSIFINKTGASGNLLQLQNAASDKFVVDTNGNLSITSATGTALFISQSGGTRTLSFGNSGLIDNSTLVVGTTTYASRAQVELVSAAGTPSRAVLEARAGSASQTGNIFQTAAVNTEVLSGFNATGGLFTYGTNNTFGHLATPAFTTVSTGTSFYYCITATNAAGETVCSSGLGMANNTSTLQWTQVNGATGYKIYRNTTNTFTAGSLLLTTITNGTTVSYADTGSATGAGLPPSSPVGSTLTIQGWAPGVSGQTNNVLAVNTNGANVLTVSGSGVTTAAGRLVVGNVNSAGGSALSVVNSGGNTATVVATIRGAASQAGDLFQLHDSSSNVNAAFNGTGAQLTLGRIAASGTVTQGKLVLSDGTTSNFGLTLQSATLTANRTITFPDASGTVQLAPTSGSFIKQIPSSTAENTITPTDASVVGLTINGTSNATGAIAAVINQSRAFTALDVNVTNTAGTQTNAVQIARNGAGGTTTNLLNLTNTTGTATHGLTFTGTFATNLINAPNFTVSNAGAINGSSLATTGSISVGTSSGNINCGVSCRTFVGTATDLGGYLNVGGDTTNRQRLILRAVASQTAENLLVQDPNGVSLSKIDAAGAFTTYGTNNTFGHLATPAFTTVSTGTSFYYCITATNAAGETVCSSGLGMANNTSTLQWTQVNGATGYKIYRNTTNTFTAGSLLLTTITNGTTVSYADTGSATGAGLPPTAPTGTKLVVQGWESQGTLFQAVGSTGLAKLTVNANGQNIVNGSTALGNSTFSVYSNGTTTPVFAGRGSVGQAANLFELYDSSNNLHAAFNSTGNQLTLGRIAASGTVSQGKLVLGDGTTDNFRLTLQSNTLTANRTINLPDEDGTICLQGSTNCGFATTGSLGGYVQLAPAAAQTDATTNSSIFINKTGASGNLVQLQNSGSDVFTISGTGAVGAVGVASTGGISSTGGAVSLTGNAASSLTTSAGALTLTSAAAATWSTAAGDLTLQAGSGTVSLGTSTNLTSAGALSIRSGGAGAFNLDTSGAAAMNIGTTNASSININRTGGTTTIYGATLYNAGGVLNINAMPNFNTTGTLRIGRSDGTLRYSDIITYNDSTAAGNYIKFSVHNGTLGSTTDVLTLSGDATASFAGAVSAVGVNAGSGLLQGTGGLTITGATSLTGAAAGNGVSTTINTGATSNTGLVVKGVASQTANLFELQDSTGAFVVHADAGGNVNSLGYISNPWGGVGIAANLLVQSEAFDNASWTKTSVTAPTANTVSDPRQTTGAESLATTASGGSVSQSSSTAVGSTYTFSVWLKTASGTQTAALRIDGSTSGTGTVKNVTATTTWQRFFVTQNTSGFAGNVRVLIFPGGTGGTGTVHAWGAQLSQSSVPLVYLRTDGGSLSTQSGLMSSGNLFISGSSILNAGLTVNNGTGTFNTGVTIPTANGLTLGTTGTNNGGIIFRSSNASAGNVTLRVSTTQGTTARTLTLPDEDGVLCVQGSTNCGFAATTGGTGYIQNQNAAQQATSNFWISGVGRADTAFSAPAIRPTADSTTAFQIQGATGSSTVLVADTSNLRIGIGAGAAPEETLDVSGNLQVKNAGDTKSYRLRTSGGALDLEAAGANLVLSVWSGASYSGTQYNQITFKNDGGSMDFARGFNISDAAARVGLGGNLNPQHTLDITGTAQATVSVLTPLLATPDVVTGTSNALTIRSGNATAGNGNSGNVSVDVGSKDGTGTAGTLSLGATNASAVVLGNGAGTLALNSDTFNLSSAGAVSGVTGYTQASGNFIQNGTGTFGTGTGAVSLNGNTTVTSGNSLTVAGGTVAFQKGTDYSTTGTSNDVNLGNSALVRLTGASAQTITGIAGGVDGRLLTIINAGSATAVISNNSGSSIAANRITTGTGGDINLVVGASISMVYDSGASLWRVTGASAATGGVGVNTIGTFNSATSYANGAQISGTTLTFGAADATNPGMVSTAAQTFAGDKTFNGQIIGAAGISSTGGAVSLTGNAASSLTTSAGALTLTSAAAATWSTAAGDLTLQAGSGTVSLGTSTTLTANGALTVRSTGATDLTLDTGGAATLNLGNTNATTINLGGGSANQTLNIGNSSGNDTVNIATGSGTDAVNIGSTGTAVSVVGTTTITAGATGVIPLTVQGIAGQTASLFQVKTSSGGTLALNMTSDGSAFFAGAQPAQVTSGNGTAAGVFGYGFTATGAAGGHTTDAGGDGGSGAHVSLTGGAGGNAGAGGDAGAGGSVILQGGAPGTGASGFWGGVNIQSGGGYTGIGTNAGLNTLLVKGVTTTDLTAVAMIGTGGTNFKGVVIQGVAGQTANLLELQNSTGAAGIVFSVGSAGLITSTGGMTLTGTTQINATGNSNVTIGNTGGSGLVTLAGASGNVRFDTANAQFTESASTRTFGVQGRTSNAAGTALTIAAGTAGSGASAFVGGALTLQGGNAAGTGNANGGNVNISGGTGVGTGARGLVVIDTPTVNTTTTDANCGATTAVNCTIAAATVNNTSSVIVGASASGVTISMPDPTITTAGRIFYFTAANGSQDFTLSLNGGGTGNTIAMRQNTTATLIWNGSDWTAAGASSSTTLQSAYDSTLSSAGGAEIVLNNSASSNGLTIRNNATSPIAGGLLEIQTSIGSNLFSVNNNATEYANNGGAESSTFTMWTGTPAGGTVGQSTTAGTMATGQASVSVVTTTTNHGAENTLTTTLTNNLQYTVSFTAKAASSSFSTLDVLYSQDGTNTTACATGKTVTTAIWTRVSCTFTAPASGITASNSIFIRQSDGTGRTFYIDNLSVTVNAGTNHAADGSVDLALGSNWTAYDADGGAGTTTPTRDTTTIYDTSGSVQDVTTAHVNLGVRNNMSIVPSVSTQYLVSFYARSSNTFNDIRVGFLPAGGSSTPAAAQLCSDYNTQSVSTTGWTKITCIITTPSSGISDPDLVIYQPTATARTFYVDALTISLNTNTASNVQVGGGSNGGPATLFTLDRSATAPIAANNDAYLGSMYYDTVTGRIQCYEADGWGACGAAPDTSVVLTPEYTGAVLNGTGVGTLTADFCSNQAGILSVNTSFCASGLARNYYKWTSPQSTMQTYSIYVSYKLPSTFKTFNDDSTINLTALTDSTSNGSVTYEVFRSSGSAVSRCYDGGTNETAVTSTANTWQTVGINGNEATSCSFTANDSVIFKINVKAQNNANVYVENLSFVYTNK